MDENDNSEDITQIRSFDPAARVSAPDALRARIAAITSDTGSETTMTDTAPQPESAADEPRAPIALRPKRRWIAPVAAASALVVGLGGGYFVGSGTFAAPIDESVVALPVEETPGEETPTDDPPAGAVPVEIGTTDNPAPPTQFEPAGVGGDGVEVDPWHYMNKRRFIVPNFTGGPDTAPAYALDATTFFSAENAEEIAAALGLVGEAQLRTEHEVIWSVGDPYVFPIQESLILQPRSEGIVIYTTGIPQPQEVCQYSSETCITDTPLPTEQQARDALSLFLSAIHVDETETTITLETDEWTRLTTARASRVIDGNETTIGAQVTVSHEGILTASGSGASIQALGEYAILSPNDAAERLNDPAYAPNFPAQRALNVEYVEGESVAPTAPPAVPTAGAPLPWGISEFEIVSAQLSMATVIGIQGETILVPAYAFTDTEGNIWTVPALEESALDTRGGGSRPW